MVPILTGKDVFEPSCNDIKFMVQNHSCSFTNLNIIVSHQVMSTSFVILWSIACQAPLFIGFPKHEYWNWLLFPSLEDLPSRDQTHVSCIAGGFTTEPSGQPCMYVYIHSNYLKILNQYAKIVCLV